MKYLVAFTMSCLPMAASTATNQLEYDLDVNGMVCAFCAYNVSKQIESLDGVVPQTVDVDLEQGTVKLRSEKKLDEIRLADLLLQAGFTLGAVTEAVASATQPRQASDEAALLSITMNADDLNEGEFDTILEQLGAIAVQRSGRISVVGPRELEVAILKPVLAGRRSVIKVDYEQVNRPDQAVVVSVMVNPTSSAE
ncbi:MAG: heavy-metal-associated domain-containing protein [Proteobacteria bacterium]|nr:heavy-metal-associated domain-containing protein [Pseudomonadota bacterium]